jgi:hypothetical protein
MMKGCTIAHHRHSVEQFTAGKRLGVPRILVIREPREAIQSLVTYAPVSKRVATFSYWRFHSTVARYLDGVGVLTFSEATQDQEAISEVLKKLVPHCSGRTALTYQLVAASIANALEVMTGRSGTLPQSLPSEARQSHTELTFENWLDRRLLKLAHQSYTKVLAERQSLCD